jgi:hypothetical protein
LTETFEAYDGPKGGHVKKIWLLSFVFSLGISLNLFGSAIGQQQPQQVQPPEQCGADCGLGGGGGEQLLCSSYDAVYSENLNFNFWDDTEHYTGAHGVWVNNAATCMYTQSGGQLWDGRWPCVVTASMHFAYSPSENGLIWEFTNLYWHLQNYASASSTNSGSSAVSNGTTAYAVTTCSQYDDGCQATGITWSGLSPQYVYRWDWSGEELYDVHENWPQLSCPQETSDDESPVVIDLEGKDFKGAFTSKAGGIVWDFQGTNRPHELSWTAKDRRIGFLVLDRDEYGNACPSDFPGCDGKITSGKELFGNITHQPLTKAEYDALPSTKAFSANGFHALSYFDRKEHGGNGDGWITKEDSIWPKLRVWVDTCHNGDSSCGENYTLDELGIVGLPTAGVLSNAVDENGNQLRYKAVVKIDPKLVGATIPQVTDVYFTAK